MIDKLNNNVNNPSTANVHTNNDNDSNKNKTTNQINSINNNNNNENLNKEKNENENFDILNFNQNLSESQKTNIIVRLSLIAFGFAIWLLYRNMLKSTDKKWNFLYCFEDRLLSEVFLPITNYISQNLYIRDFLLIASSAFLDVFMICFICVYISKGNSWGPLLHMGLFYGLRGAVVQNLVIMQIYDTYIFEYPGFPSLVVPYFRAADFFYSGHSGCALLLGLQMADMGYSEMKYVGFLVGIFEGLVLTMLRIHYSIDIIFGMITSHYLYYVTKEVAKYADRIYPMGAPEDKIRFGLVKDKDVRKTQIREESKQDDNIKVEKEHNTSFIAEDGLDKDGKEYENNKEEKKEKISLDLNRIESSRALNSNYQMDEIIEGRRK